MLPDQFKKINKIYLQLRLFVVKYLYGIILEVLRMKHIETLNNPCFKETAAEGGCGECRTSCQSACKTSCTVANQECEKK